MLTKLVSYFRGAIRKQQDCEFLSGLIVTCCLLVLWNIPQACICPPVKLSYMWLHLSLTVWKNV